MDIVTAPDNVLLQKASPVKVFDKKLKNLITDMKQALIKSEIGVGLAAPQVGLPLRLFIASPNLPDVKNKQKEPIRVFINPTYITVGKKQTKKAKQTNKTILEGCLSIPEVWGKVERPTTVTLSFQDQTGKKHEEAFTKFWATIIQHEMDHLEGVLFSRHVLTQGNSLYRQVDDEFEKIEV